jgi:uncharacterized surface protein with fasciclin (FAS1) repeats
MKNFIAISALAFVSFAVPPLCAQSGQTKKDIIESIADTGRFTQFLKAVQAAGLNEVLKGPGPFTLFAPNDDAFHKLPKNALDQLLSNPTRLKQVVTYHVVPSKLSSEQVKHLTSARSLLGTPLWIRNVRGKITVNDAILVNPDVDCTNGVVHVIDAVLIPK